MIRFLIAFSVACSGLERIDFGFGSQAYSITPSVILTPLAILALIFSKNNSGPKLGARGQIGWILLSAFLFVAAASILFHPTTDRALRQFILFVLLAVGMWGVITLAKRNNLQKELAKGAWIGLALAVLFSLGQIATWVSLGPGIQAVFGPFNLTSPTYGPYAPRPAGLSIDPNRGAFSATLMFFIISCDPWVRKTQSITTRSWSMIISLVVVALTFSRSGIAVWILVFIAYLVYSYVDNLKVQYVRIFLLFATLGFVLNQFFLSSRENFSFDRLFSERSDLAVGNSASMHFDYYVIANELLGRDQTAAWTGFGFGSSNSLLAAYFPNKVEANFHSQYVTALLEMGFLGLLILLALIIGAIFTTRWVLGLSIAIFCIFYQAHLDGTFWLALGLAWLAPSALQENNNDSQQVWKNRLSSHYLDSTRIFKPIK